jgi:hypothetical protein
MATHYFKAGGLAVEKLIFVHGQVEKLVKIDGIVLKNNKIEN